MDLPPGSSPSLLQRIRAGRKAASGTDYAILTGLVAVAVLGAVVLTGDRVRSLFTASETTVSDGVAGLPLPEPPPPSGGGPTVPAGQGVWSGEGTFVLSPLTTPQARTAVLTNVGGGPLALGGAPAVSGSGASAFQVLGSDCGASLSAGDSCAVQVQASAGANGAAQATLSIPGVTGGLALSRTATGFDPLLAWTPSAPVLLDGSTATPATAQAVLTLRNDGFAPGQTAPIAVSGAGWSLAGTTCGPILAPAATCTVTLQAQATDNGPLPEATLSAGGATTTVGGSAAGFAAVLAWSGQTDLAIGAPPATPATVQQTLTLTNSGTLAATGLAPAVSGDPAFALVSTTCGAALAPGAACEATVSFTADADVAQASAQISAGGVPDALAALSGSATGIAPALAWSGAPVALDGAPPATLPVAGQTTYTLINTGNQDATGLGTVAMSGAGWSLLGTTCGPTLAQGASCDATLRLEASANGTFPGTLSIAGGPSLALAGGATGFAPALAWAGTPTFAIDGAPGSEPLPRTAQQTFTLTNAGTAPATGLSVGVAGAGFAASANTCTTTLGVGQSCSLTVTASASADGAFAGTLSSGGPTPATQALSASASGFAPTLSWVIAPTFAIDGTPGAGPLPRSSTQIFRLANTGTAPATGLAIAVSGPGFALSAPGTTCTAVLGAGQGCNVAVVATAADNGPLSGSLATGGTVPAVQALTGAATGFAGALAWTALPDAQTLNTANGGVTQPATAAPGPTGLATLTNTGTLPAGPITIAFAGPDAAAFETAGDACSGQTLVPGATCTVGVRLVAGLFPADYTLQMSAAASPATLSETRVQRVSGPRLVFVQQLFNDTPQTADHGVWSGTLPANSATSGGIHEIRIRNVGNAPTGPMQADRAALQNAGFTLAWRPDDRNGPVLIQNTVGTSANATGTGAGAPAATIDLAPGQFGNLRTRLMLGQDLAALTGPITGPRTFTGVVRLGGVEFPEAVVSATYLAATAFAWSGGGAFNVTSPTAVPALANQTFTLTNSGNIPAAPPAIAVADGGTGGGFSLVSTTCGATLNPTQTCTALVRASYADAAPAATGILSAGAATTPLTGAASGCVAGNQVFTASGTFTRPGFFQGCGTVRILAVGGGGGGSNGHANAGISGAGGGSGRVAQATHTPATLPAGPIAVTVGGGGAGGISAAGAPTSPAWNGQNGQASTFGTLLTAGGGAGAITGACWWSHPSCDWASAPASRMAIGGGAPFFLASGYGVAGSAGGAAGVAGASNGSSTAANPDLTPLVPGFVIPGANGQGPFPLGGFTQRTLGAGAGGAASPATFTSPISLPWAGHSPPNSVAPVVQDGSSYRRAGGGGGGVTISGASPVQAAQAGTSEANGDPSTWPHDAWVTVGGQPGQGFGAGGGGGARRRGGGGQGGSGAVYVEWGP